MEKHEMEIARAVVKFYAGKSSGGLVQGNPPEMFLYPLTAVECDSVATYLQGYQSSGVAVSKRDFPGGSVNVLIVLADARDDALALFARWLVDCDPTSKVPTIKEGKKVLPGDDAEQKALCQVAIRVGKDLLDLAEIESS